VQVAVDTVRSALERRAGELGFDAPAAALLADHFLDAEMRGAGTHGVGRMRWIAGFADLRPAAAPAPVERAEGVARYDAAGALGYLALAGALDAELARPPDGARLVVVGGCFPTGRLGWFAARAARHGLAALVWASSTPRIVHPDGGPPVTGTNPLCLALPGDPPTVIDVSMGRVTYGDVLRAADAGEPLAEGAAARTDGAIETDPAEVMAGRAGIVPFGGGQSHKGFALALIVELLATSLSPVDGDAACVLLAQPRAQPAAAMRRALAGLRFPGDTSERRAQKAAACGRIEVDDDLWAWLEPATTPAR
jgi:LDH2 family malate/lactate/ureidoglycolate dehydrogenase